MRSTVVPSKFRITRVHDAFSKMRPNACFSVSDSERGRARGLWGRLHSLRRPFGICFGLVSAHKGRCCTCVRHNWQTHCTHHILGQRVPQHDCLGLELATHPQAGGTVRGDDFVERGGSEDDLVSNGGAQPRAAINDRWCGGLRGWVISSWRLEEPGLFGPGQLEIAEFAHGNIIPR